MSPALAPGMACWSTVEGAENALQLVTECCIVVFDCMLIFSLSMSVKALEILFTEAADVLAPQAGDLKPDDLPSPLHLLCIIKKLNLS